jgi:hypothetical protein
VAHAVVLDSCASAEQVETAARLVA